MRIAAGIEYCGAGFSGWQSQEQGRNVQDCLEAALASVADHPVKVHCAGRTDAGVHAMQQVVHFDTRAEREPHAWVLGGNVSLPRDVRILWACTVEDSFHARFSATGRQYRYLILNRIAAAAVYNGLVTWECRHLDVARMQEAARCLLGEHDFSAFRAVACQAKSPVREVRQLEVRRHGDLIIIDVRANAFLYHMVRNIAGVLMAIGVGKEPVTWTRQVLESRNRTAGGITAPADGLYLVDIEYPAAFGLPKQTVSQWLLHHEEAGCDTDRDLPV